MLVNLGLLLEISFITLIKDKIGKNYFFYKKLNLFLLRIKVLSTSIVL
jgi:hypothetical protein